MKAMEGPRYSPKVYYNLFYQDISSLGWEISHWSKVQNPQSSAATLRAVSGSPWNCPYQVLYSGRTVFSVQSCNKWVKTRNIKWQKWVEDYKKQMKQLPKYSSMFAVWKVLHLAEFKGENVIFSVHSFHFILHVVISHLHIYYI